MIRVVLALSCTVAVASPAAAIVGGGRKVSVAEVPVVAVLGKRSDGAHRTRAVFCTATPLARDIVLTAAHCVWPDAQVGIVPYPGARPTPASKIAWHPQFSASAYERHRATADVALLKLSAPLPETISPVALGEPGEIAAVGDRLMIAGVGSTVSGADEFDGLLRAATLVVTGRPGNLQIRLVDPRTRGERPGLGGCSGDSGGPALRNAGGGRLRVIGVISWTTAPGDEEGCGGLTGITPLSLYRPWIMEQLANWGVGVR
jgi:hypothetical protein